MDRLLPERRGHPVTQTWAAGVPKRVQDGVYGTHLRGRRAGGTARPACLWLLTPPFLELEALNLTSENLEGHKTDTREKGENTGN